MYYNRIYVVVIASFVLFTIVKGSCLEYGHSCWGAHGKRSGNSGRVGKLLRAAANLRNNENDGNNSAQNVKSLFDSMDELKTSTENKQNSYTNNEEEHNERSPESMQDPLKLRTHLRKQNARLQNKNRIANDDSSLEQQEERFVERWRKLPLYNLKPLTKTQRSNSENDLVQQPGKIFVADESLYYDFQ